MYGVEHKLIGILISLGIFFQSYAVRKAVGTYLHPAALFSLIWFAYTILPLTILFEAPINALSVFFIFLCTLAFSLGAIPFDWRRAYRVSRNSKAGFDPRFNSKFMLLCLIAAFSLSIVFSTLTMIINGWSIESMLSDLLYVSGRFAALRGNEGMEYGLIGILGVFFTYLSAALGGLVSYSRQPITQKVMCGSMAIFPALFSMVIQSSKLIFLVAISFYIASLLLAKVYASNLRLIKRKYIFRTLLIIALVMPFILFSFFSREGYSDFEDIGASMSLLRYALASYALGEVYAFSDFFSFYLGMNAQSGYLHDFYSLGAYTFAAVYQTLGFPKEFPAGLYTESVYYSDLYETNVFTVFRGLIYDFGGVGTIIFFFAIGLIINYFFHRLLWKKNSWLSCVIFTWITVFSIMSYLISVFMARYMFLNGAAVYVILAVNARIKAAKLKSPFSAKSGAAPLSSAREKLSMAIPSAEI